jgi:multiple sugar transport system permease protein
MEIGSMKRSLGLRALRRDLLPLMLLTPALIALIMFSLYPFLSGIWYSFSSIRWIGDEATFAGLQNYRRILVGEFGAAAFFRQAFTQGVQWTLVVVGGQFTLGMIAALVLNERFPGRGLFRVALMVPIAVPTVILSLTWQWMYDPFYGLINHYLNMVGLISGPKAWVGQPNSSLWPIMVAGIWRGFPFMTVMLLSGLQGIQKEIYEAATVDGANLVQRFRYVTLSHLRTTISIAVMLHLIWWWNHFDLIRILGGGHAFSYGAMTLPILAWYEAFQWNRLSSGAAISVISMVVMGGVMFWNARREVRSVKI